jgi:hypothetical protein
LYSLDLSVRLRFRDRMKENFILIEFTRTQRINNKFHIIIIIIIIIKNMKTDYIKYKNSFRLNVSRFSETTI